MFLDFNFYKSKELVHSALVGRNIRQQMISGNIANIDTPFYKAKDIDFESALIEQANKIYGKQEGTINNANLELAQTHKEHFPAVKFPDYSKATIYLRDGHMARNDANTVDLDVETTELSKNSIMITALDSAMKKFDGILKNVLETSGRI